MSPQVKYTQSLSHYILKLEWKKINKTEVESREKKNKNIILPLSFNGTMTLPEIEKNVHIRIRRTYRNKNESQWKMVFYYKDHLLYLIWQNIRQNKIKITQKNGKIADDK